MRSKEKKMEMEGERNHRCAIARIHFFSSLVVHAYSEQNLQLLQNISLYLRPRSRDRSREIAHAQARAGSRSGLRLNRSSSQLPPL